MNGAIVPAVVLPRFTSYIGGGTFITEPMLVEEFLTFQGIVWRGPLVGGAASNPFRLYLEESLDASAATWAATSPITTADAWSACGMFFTKKWFRVRVELAADTDGVVGITLWMVGELERRER